MSFTEAQLVLVGLLRYQVENEDHHDVAVQWHRPGEAPPRGKAVASGLIHLRPEFKHEDYVTFTHNGEVIGRFFGLQAYQLMRLGSVADEGAFECVQCDELYAGPVGDGLCYYCAKKARKTP